MKTHGITVIDGRYKIANRRTRRPVDGDWNDYATYTGCASGLRAFRKHGPPARSGQFVTPPEVKKIRRRP